MSDSLMIWLALFVAGAVSYSLRFLPFVLFKNANVDKEHIVFQYLAYFAYAIMGCLIYEAAFDSRNITMFVHSFNELAVLKLAAMLLAFLLYFFLRRMLLSLLLAVAAYALVLFLLLH